MKLKIQKFLTILLIAQLVFLNSLPVVSAQEVSPTPEASTTVTEQTVSTETNSTTPEIQATTESSTQIQEQSATVDSSPTPTPDPLSNWNNLTDQQKEEYRNEQKDAASSQYLSIQGISPAPSGSGNSGDTTIATGDAQNSAAVVNSANTNLSSSPLAGGSGGSMSVINSDNGSSSNNSGSATVVNNDTTDQDNSARVLSGLDQSATTGNNDGNFNVGSTALTTGDANTTGTVINAVNTNVDGVMVSEFNIVDDHVGDIILDFSANCISGCGLLGLNSQNTSNGADSTNTANSNLINNTNTFQNNDGTVGNEMVLSADSGNNSTSYNTGGDSTITTGDANVAGNALTFLNNNIAGNVVFSVVNVFGDLVGDIIFPESQLSCCGGSLTATNSGNGAESTNTANASLINSDATFQTNDATINNNLVFDANTGDNSTGYNTGGNSTINTGQANVDANILNIANTNIVGGNMWLVLINHAGNWVGKLIGAPEGQSYLGSEGLEFVIGPSGEVNVSNNDNGANSTNTANATSITNNTTVQNNNGTVNNTLNFSANTGGNDANYNTGGNSTINTGDANIIANLVNFVNNNIVGDGKLFVTIVNVFGSWTGDFVGPGQQQQNKEAGSKNQESSDVQNTNSSNSNAGSTTNTTNNSQGLIGSLLSSNGSGSGGSETKTGTVTLSSNFTNGANTNSASTNSNTNTNSQSGLLASAKVLAMHTQGADVEKNTKVKINLAWFMLLLPIIFLVILVKKLVVRRFF